MYVTPCDRKLFRWYPHQYINQRHTRRGREVIRWNIYPLHKLPRSGVSPHGAYRPCATKIELRARCVSVILGQFPMIPPSPLTRESKAASISSKLLKKKNEPQTIATLTRNQSRYSVASSPKSLVCSGFLRYYVIEYFSRSPHEFSPNSQFFLSRFFSRGR